MKKFALGFLFSLGLALLVTSAHGADNDIPPPGPDAMALPAGSTPPPTSGPVPVAHPAMSAPAPNPAAPNPHKSNVGADQPVNHTAETDTQLSGHQYLAKATFGPSECKTDELSKQVSNDLRGECDGWVNARRAELGGRYITGTCTQKCEECQYHLRRCSYEGTVHYEN